MIHPDLFYFDTLYQSYNHSRYITTDPIQIPCQYKNSTDQEAVGFITAVFSFGRVNRIVSTCQTLFDQFGPFFVKNLIAADEWIIKKKVEGINYRFFSQDDIIMLFLFTRYLYQTHLSLIQINHTSLTNWYITLFNEWKSFLKRKDYYSNGTQFMFPSPDSVSASKRLNMFFRWMVRKDAIDLGLWQNQFNAEELKYPVDTHLARISYFLRIIEKPTLSKQNSERITEFFRILFPADPVKFDFALSRLGILKECPRTKSITSCNRCTIFKVCGR